MLKHPVILQNGRGAAIKNGPLTNLNVQAPTYIIDWLKQEGHIRSLATGQNITAAVIVRELLLKAYKRRCGK